MKPALSLNEKVAALGLSAAGLAAPAAEPACWSWARTPPMGWNSWDCDGAGAGDSNVIENPGYMARNLKSRGWDIITIDQSCVHFEACPMSS